MPSSSPSVTTESSTSYGRGTAILALALVGWGAYLRLHGLNDPGLWLDEILAFLPNRPPETGPLYYWVLYAARAVSEHEWVIRLPYAMAGVITIWLAFVLGARLAGPTSGLFAALLVTLSPLHIYYSREARPYSLLVLAGFGGACALVSMATGRAGRRAWMLFASALIALLLISSNGLFYVALLLAAAGVMCLLSVGRDARAAAYSAAACLGLGVVCAALFFGLYHSILLSQGGGAFELPGWHWFATLVPPLISGYTEQSSPLLSGQIGVGLAGLGLLCLLVARPRLGLMWLAAVIAGVLVPIVALLQQQHGINVRYMLPAFMPLLVAIACLGIPVDRLVRGAAPRTQLVARAVALGLAALLVSTVQRPIIADAINSKADWRFVASIVQARTRPGDVVITSNDWAKICLEYYLPSAQTGLTFASANESTEAAQQLAETRGAGLLVAGGFHATPAIRQWVERFPEIYSGRREAIRVTFYPDRAAYVRTRLAKSEAARDETWLWETAGGAIDLRWHSERFLLAGWGPERRDDQGIVYRDLPEAMAAFYVPSVATLPSAIAFDVRVDGGDPGQLTFAINQHPAETLVLASGWTRARLALPADSLGQGTKSWGNVVTMHVRAGADGSAGRRGFKVRELRLVR